MNTEEKYALITKLYNQEGILVTSSHPDGVKCHFAIQWDEDVDDYIYDEHCDSHMDDFDVDSYKEEIKYQICIWDACHESDLGILYCTADDIEIIGNRLTINCSGKHVYGSMMEMADSDDEIEFEMFIPFTK
jgi:hypothetical protein